MCVTRQEDACASWYKAYCSGMSCKSFFLIKMIEMLHL